LQNYTFKVTPKNYDVANKEPMANKPFKPVAPPESFNTPHGPEFPFSPYDQSPPFNFIGPQFPDPLYHNPCFPPGTEPAVPGLPGYTVRPSLGHAYVPWQFYGGVYNPQEALSKGTLFPELNQPQGEYGPCEGPKPCKLVNPRGGALDAEE